MVWTVTVARAEDPDDDNTRAVKVIQSPDAPGSLAPAGAPPPALAVPPDAPATQPMPPAAATPPPIHPGADSAGIVLKPVGTPAPSVQSDSPPVARPQVALGSIPIDTKTGNPADVSLDVLPGLDVALGSKVSFRVTTKKAGYLVLVDVDASGKLSQIYPAPAALTGARIAKPNANYVKPGKPLFIPSVGDGYSGLEYIASPPAGVAMIVAILSDRPVQFLDLPDVPANLTGQAEALAYLTKFAKELRIPQGNNLIQAQWSFDAKFYAIR